MTDRVRMFRHYYDTRQEAALKIVDVDIRDLSRATRRVRERSEVTEQLVEVISNLKSSDARAIILDAGDTARKLRSRLSYAARIAGKRLQIGITDDRVLFALSNRPARRRRSAPKN